MRRRYTGPRPKTLDALRERCGLRCERCATPFTHSNGGDPHHRRPRGMGGSSETGTNRLGNLVGICRPCHDHIESHRARSLAEGWLVPQGRDPRSVPVLSQLHGGWVLLSDDGSVTPATGGAA